MNLKGYNNGVLNIKFFGNHFDVMARNFNETDNIITKYTRLLHCFSNDSIGFSLQFYNDYNQDFSKIYYTYFLKMLKDGVFWHNLKEVLDSNKNDKPIATISWNDDLKDNKLGTLFNYIYNVIIRNYAMTKFDVIETLKQNLYSKSNVYMVF